MTSHLPPTAWRPKTLALAGGPAGADSVGTLQVNGTFNNQFFPVACPAGTPATTACHGNASVRANLIPGLGKVTMASYTLVLDDFGSACMRLHAQIPILVAGKGEIDLTMPTSGCITPEQLSGRVPPIDVTVSGGSGPYAVPLRAARFCEKRYKARHITGLGVWAEAISIGWGGGAGGPGRAAGFEENGGGGRVALALTLVGGASGTSQATGTLQLKAKFPVKWHFLPACPPGQPSTVTCYLFEGQAVVPGLGRVTEKYMKTFDGQCARTLPDFVVTVAGKGDLSGSVTGPACGAVPPTQVTLDATITGGTGIYAGSVRKHSDHVSHLRAGRRGGGRHRHLLRHAQRARARVRRDRASLERSAREDGAGSERREARKVRYVVTAKDAVDGSVATVCKLRSGAFFKIGRTTVTCRAVDSSANTATARFIVTVKPARR